MEAQQQAAIRTVFHELLNWVSTLPVNAVTTWLDGALLMVRKSFFNQTPSVHAVQTTATSLLVKGRIDVTDPDGNAWNIAVVENPSHGAVVLDAPTQANGIGTANYSYTPGPDYTGDDQFVVAVTSPSSALTAAPNADTVVTRYYTVAVGNSAAAANSCFGCEGSDAKDTPDTHLYLAHAEATITVEKRGLLFPRYEATVTLPAATAAKVFSWRDARGNTGFISVDQMLTEDWAAYDQKAGENGVKPLLMFQYSDQGTDKAVFVDVSAVTKKDDGTYALTGQLTFDAPAQQGRVDQWDYLGVRYKTAYENFLAASGLADCKSGHVCSSVTAVGTLGATTLSPSAYTDGGGHDYSLPTPGDASATQTFPGAIGPGQVSTNQGHGTDILGSTGDTEIQQTAMVPWGTSGSFITASNLTQGSSEGSLNGVYLYTATSNGASPTWAAPVQLANNSWNAAPNVIARYDQPITDLTTGDLLPTTYTGAPPNFALTGSISASGTTPAVFTGSINGTTLIVTSVVSGTLAPNDFVVGGPANNTAISNQLSGTSGGVGTYQLNVAQSWPSGGGTGTMTAGVGGSTLQISLASLTAAGVTDYSSLVGAYVSGTDVASGTAITAYQGTSGTNAAYTVSTYNLAGTGAISVTDPTGTIIPADLLTLYVPHDVDPGSLIGQSITGAGGITDIPPGTTITGFVAANLANAGDVLYTVNNPITYSAGTIGVELPDVPQLQRGLVVGLSDGSVQYWNGNMTPDPAGGTLGWTQLQAPSAWGEDNPVNNLIALPNNQGIVVGMHDTSVYLFNSSISTDGTIIPASEASGCSSSSPSGCWTQLNDGQWDAFIDVMIPYGQNGGFLVGLNNGAVEQWNGSSWTELQGTGWNSAVQTMIPYDGTTLVGSISGTPVIATDGVIEAPSYVSPSWTANSPALLAAESRCPSGNYSGGQNQGCGGYVLTVQQAAGNPIRVGQTLYGGAGIASGTTITEQISDADGNLCSTGTCNAGGAGVYLVNTSQLVAPGTPMSASDGTGFVVGLDNGAVWQYNNGFTELLDEAVASSLAGDYGAVNTMIPLRDGFVVAQNDGVVYYWSPSNNASGDNSNNPNALDYVGSNMPSLANVGSPGWSMLHATGWIDSPTAMVQMGDSFALGLTAADSTQSGVVALYTGFGAVDSASAFGYLGSQPLTGSSLNSWSIPAEPGTLSDDPLGSVQQMFSTAQVTQDSSGNRVLAQSLVVGLTNNGIYAWNGSNANATQNWTDIQTPATTTLNPTMLQAAWNYGPSADGNWGGSGEVGAAGITGDPVFGLQPNQAWCGSGCSSSGDYYTFAINHPFGNDGVIYSLGSILQGDLNLTAQAYGYVFVPNSIWDMFKADYYSAGLFLAAQGGPSVSLNPPDGLQISDTISVTGPSFSETKETEFGSLGVNVGIDASISASIGLQSTPVAPLTLAWALDTPGVLFMWNTYGNQDALSLTFANWSNAGYLEPATIADTFDVSNATANASVSVTPSIALSYGLFTPSSWPISFDLFKLSIGYSNPVLANLNVPLLAADNSSLTLDAQGILTISAGLLPGLTSDLSWTDQIQLYNESGVITA